MSHSIAQTRRRLPLYYLALPAAAGLTLLWPRWPLITDLSRWYLLPLWVALAHLFCGIGHTITTGKLQRGRFLLKSSLYVYTEYRSLVHLQAAFLVAVAEEALFRYVGLGWLSAATGSPALAWAATTIAFGLAHLPMLIRGGSAAAARRLADLTLFGGLLGALVLWTGSIWPAVIIHGLRNYILRCLLVSKEEYAQYHADRLLARLDARDGAPVPESETTPLPPDEDDDERSSR
jgi:membrane protease YdiL (CAAX protease family)